MKSSRVLTLMAVMGALLGFSLEPLVGRLVTLSFGGAIHVWAVVVLVFQTVLLLAYAWAHLVARRWPLAHLVAVSAGVLLLPINVVATPDPTAGVLHLTMTVLLAVGLPFFGLSSAAVVAQSWATREGNAEPWGLYAASNAGSLVGLFAYPLLVEPTLGLGHQKLVWSVGYALFVVVVGYSAWTARPGTAPPLSSSWPKPKRIASWLLLAMAPSVISLAVTGWIGTEFGSFPLLWSLPLGLYLGSFMLAFSERVPSGWIRPFWPDALAGVALFASLAGEPAMHPLLYGAFFIVCWQLHAALFRQRPAASDLTLFYLVIALGGWLGGLFVTLIAPAVFPGLWELPLGLLLAAAALLLTEGLPDLAWFKRVEWRWAVSRLALTGTLLLLTGMWWNLQRQKGTVASVRSLYGVFHVRERTLDGGERIRELVHGGTSHGSQYLAPDPRSMTPMSYYHPAGSNAEALGLRRGHRVAGIGLGAGAIAGLMRPGEELVFYELDPNSELLARTWFTYLEDSPAEVSVRIGDARLVMAAESEDYDAIFVDAFSGDGIPTHLLTEEAFEIYLDHLVEDGILVLHISNRFLDLRGVVKALSQRTHLAGAIRFETPDAPAHDDPLYAPAVSVVLGRSADRLSGLSDQWTSFGPEDGLPSHRAWTDDHIDLLQPLGLR